MHIHAFLRHLSEHTSRHARRKRGYFAFIYISTRVHICIHTCVCTCAFLLICVYMYVFIHRIVSSAPVSAYFPTRRKMGGLFWSE